MGFQLPMNRHSFKKWHGTEQATYHFLNERRPSSVAAYDVTRPHLVNQVISVNIAVRVDLQITKHGGTQHP